MSEQINKRSLEGADAEAKFRQHVGEFCDSLRDRVLAAFDRGLSVSYGCEVGTKEKPTEHGWVEREPTEGFFGFVSIEGFKGERLTGDEPA